MHAVGGREPHVTAAVTGNGPRLRLAVREVIPRAAKLRHGFIRSGCGQIEGLQPGSAPEGETVALRGERQDGGSHRCDYYRKTKRG